MSYILRRTDEFKKYYKKLTKVEQAAVKRKLVLLANDPWHPSLRVKKIQSVIDVFECSVNMDIRIAFQFEGDVLILLLDIGHHDKLLKRQSRRR